jgi:hypothetical protein
MAAELKRASGEVKMTFIGGGGGSEGGRDEDDPARRRCRSTLASGER